METEDNNVIPFPEHAEDTYEPTDDDWAEAAREFFLMQDPQQIAMSVALVLELLTAKAVEQGSYYFVAENGAAITLIAVGDDVENILDTLPQHIMDWETLTMVDDVPPFETDRDPGDEQDEPTPAS